MRTCKKCKITYDSLESFDIIKATQTHRYICQKCRLKYRQTRRENKMSSKDGFRDITIKSILSSCRYRAEIKNIPFNLTYEHLDSLLSESCPVLGLKYEIKHNSPNSASVDRINNNKGYIIGNVAIISRRANTLKKDADLAELRLIEKYIRENKESTSPALGSRRSD